MLSKKVNFALTVLMNTLHALIAFGAVQTGSKPAIAVSIALFVVSNAAATLGIPLSSDMQNQAIPTPPPTTH